MTCHLTFNTCAVGNTNVLVQCKNYCEPTTDRKREAFKISVHHIIHCRTYKPGQHNIQGVSHRIIKHLLNILHKKLSQFQETTSNKTRKEESKYLNIVIGFKYLMRELIHF